MNPEAGCVVKGNEQEQKQIGREGDVLEARIAELEGALDKLRGRLEPIRFGDPQGRPDDGGERLQLCSLAGRFRDYRVRVEELVSMVEDLLREIQL